MASNWGGVISRTVAECALTLALGCLRQVPKFYREMMIDKQWRARHATDIPRSLYGRRVGIHGYGNVARELIKLLAPFQCPIQVWSEPVPASVFANDGMAQASSLHSLFSDNEVIFEVEALTDSSRGSVNESVLAALRPDSVFVNVGRGPVVDEAALLQRAQRGDITIGLDVYAQEPLAAESPLRELPNALLFPHMAGPTQDHYPVCGEAAIANLKAWLNGQPLLQPFTLEHYDRTT